jgi:hypothetical protein
MVDRAVQRRQLAFNGINGSTGRYLLPDLTPEQVATSVARTFGIEKRELAELKWRRRVASQPSFGVSERTDPTNLAEAGWGVIFAEDADPAVREALRPLLDLRRQQASAIKAHRYRELAGADGYRAGESKFDFLKRYNVGPGPANPDRLPYYLLLVGDPEAIPFRFQYELDVQFAVGRIHLDTPDEYAQYAHSVVRAEQAATGRPRRAVFFGVRNNHDQATQLGADLLVEPLVDDLSTSPIVERERWTLERVPGAETTKARLGRLLGGAETPALLFTASHGMGFDSGDPLQATSQGALLCQDWPGPVAWDGPIPPDFYFAGHDLPPDADLAGLISFHFACFGAGTPSRDSFPEMPDIEIPGLAPHDFMAALPKRLLGHPRGGSLAVVSHVDRAWSYSFEWEEAGEQLGVFSSTIERLMRGWPIGHAMEYFSNRYAELSVSLTSEIEEARRGREADEFELAFLWTANNDARSFVIVGDPAVRVRG